MRTYVCVLGVRNVSFSENFGHVLNEWSLSSKNWVNFGQKTKNSINFLPTELFCNNFLQVNKIILSCNINKVTRTIFSELDLRTGVEIAVFVNFDNLPNNISYMYFCTFTFSNKQQVYGLS